MENQLNYDSPLPGPVKLFEMFREMNLAKDQYEFSRRWLGQAPNYLSVVKSRGCSMSAAALLRLKFRLECLIEGYDDLRREHVPPVYLVLRIQKLLVLQHLIEQEIRQIELGEMSV